MKLYQWNENLVRDKKPETCQQAGELADEYVQLDKSALLQFIHTADLL